MNNNTSIWKQEKKNTQDDSLFLEVESFFDNIQNSEYLEYRDGQRNMAYSVVDAIKSKSVLLIEAGVGIGKSYAYLIPIIQSIKDNDDFEGAIIATSTIALQEQLVRDVEAVGKMLGKDDIKISLAKGKNNFICMKRLHDFLNTTGNSQYQYILDRVLEKNSIDRKDFEDISDKMWRDFNVRVCASMSCPYYADCQIVHDRIDYKKSKIIITNQDFLVQDLKHDEDERLFSQDKVVVIDEAHIVVDWGASFRVDYQCLESWRNMLLRTNPSLRTILLSGTFEDRCVATLRNFFEVSEKWIEIRCDALRHEPRYCVIRTRSYAEKQRNILELVRKLPHPMIIYVARPVEADHIKQMLAANGIKNTRTFTGLTGKVQRKKLIETWADDDYEIMIATSAFGVGVDKSDVRTVIHTYIPQSSIIGRLLNHQEEITILKSTQTGIMQHDLYTWQVLGGEFVKDELTNSSEFIDKTITNWLKEVSPEQRGEFFDTLFDILNTTEAKTLSELSKNKLETAKRLLESYKHIDDESKELLTKTLSVLFQSARVETKNLEKYYFPLCRRRMQRYIIHTMMTMDA